MSLKNCAQQSVRTAHALVRGCRVALGGGGGGGARAGSSAASTVVRTTYRERQIRRKRLMRNRPTPGT